MSGGHGQASSRLRGVATVPKKPLFYDYSEEFEDIVEPPPIDTIAPIPRRVSTSFRPVVFQNNSGEGPESMEDAQNEFEAYLQEGTNTSHHAGEAITPIDAPSQPMSLPPRDTGTNLILRQHAHDNLDSHSSMGTAAPAVSCHEVTSVLDEAVPVETTSEMKDLGQTKESAVAEITSDASTIDDPSEPKTPAFTAGIPFHAVLILKEEADPCRVSHDGRVTCQDVVPSQGHDILPALSKSTSTNLPTPHVTGADVSTLPKVSCHPRHGSRFYSLGSGLSDLASFVQQVDQHFQTPGPEDAKIVCSESQDSHPRGQISEAATTAGNSPCLGEDKKSEPEKLTNTVSHPPRMSSLRENRRQATALRVNTAVDEPHQYQVVSTRDGPTLTPQPISPAKLLRVKNSIPQLMKALPPLPGYAPAPESPFGPAVVPMEFEPFEISQLTDARSTLIDAFQADEAPKGYDAFIFDRAAHKPRLKLKHSASFAVECEHSSRRKYTTPKSASRHDAPAKRPATSTGTSTATAAATEYSTAPVKRRLPIKISRPTLTSLVPDDAGTVKRRPGMQKSSTVSELTSREPIDLFSSAVALKAAVANNETSSTQLNPHNRVHTDMPMVKITPLARIRQVPADADTRGTSLDTQMDMMRTSSVDSQPGVACEIQSFFSDNSIVKPRQGLRKRISNLRSKLAESRNHHRSPLSNLPRDDRLEDDHHDVIGISLTADGQPTGTYKEQFASTSDSKNHTYVLGKRKLRSKLERFMKGAKHKLRTWGTPKRRID
jgi:hypothetical protein